MNIDLSLFSIPNFLQNDARCGWVSKQGRSYAKQQYKNINERRHNIIFRWKGNTFYVNLVAAENSWLSLRVIAVPYGFGIAIIAIWLYDCVQFGGIATHS